MESWKDQGIVLAVRPHGENGGVVSLLTENNGRHAGYVRGARSSRMRGVLEVGNLVDVTWQSRVADALGTMALEQISSPAAFILGDRARLLALQAACALCDAALPEREGHAGLFYGAQALMEALRGDIWAESYVMWEIAFLRELGFMLDLSACAGGGDSRALAYVSPKTGRAVSMDKARGYEDRLLPLPQFLGGVLDARHPHLASPQRGEGLLEESFSSTLPPLGGGLGWGNDDPQSQDILTGLKLTAYFLEHWAFAHHTKGVPEARLRLQVGFAGESLNHPACPSAGGER